MKPKRFFQVMANKRPIEQYRIRKGPIQIGYNQQFRTFEVQAASGLSPLEFEALPGDPMWCVDSWSKAHYIAWYTLRNQIEGAGNEAQARKMDALKKQRRNGYGTRRR